MTPAASTSASATGCSGRPGRHRLHAAGRRNGPASSPPSSTASGITDLVLLGEQRPYHRPAIALARARGIAVAVTDFGYLRPDWVVLERDGMGRKAASRATPRPSWRWPRPARRRTSPRITATASPPRPAGTCSSTSRRCCPGPSRTTAASCCIRRCRPISAPRSGCCCAGGRPGRRPRGWRRCGPAARRCSSSRCRWRPTTPSAPIPASPTWTAPSARPSPASPPPPRRRRCCWSRCIRWTPG